MPSPPQQWLVHCSPERTLVARRAEGEETVLVKIFERGSLLDAQQETEIARSLTQPGVVGYRAAVQDPVTRKPCVTMDYCEGVNLEQRVIASGPLAPQRAAAIVEQVARVLTDFHTTPREHARFGVVHRDVKPPNIMLVRDDAGGTRPVLMDLEHVVARRDPTAQREVPSSVGFTGGTHGYSPPEAYVGAHPHAGFDVFAIGATLFFLLTGCSAFVQRDPRETAEFVRGGNARLRLLRGQPADLRGWIERCLATDERERPSMAEVADGLAAFAKPTEDGGRPGHEQDLALQGILAASFLVARNHLAAAATEPDHDATRQAELTELCARRTRLFERIGSAPEVDLPGLDEDDAEPDLTAIARTIHSTLPRVDAFLQRFPRHAETLQARQELSRAGHGLLERVVPTVARLKMGAQFDDARELLEETVAAAAAIERVPGGIGIPTTDSGHLPGPLLRNPTQLLQRSMHDLENAESVHRKLVERLEAAEAGLDLASAGLVVDEIIAIYGGASTVAAPLKDRLHRLDFYLQRIAWPRRLLEQLGEQLDLSDRSHTLERVEAFCDRCHESAVSDARSIRGKGGVRALLETMNQLIEDFPHAEPVAAEARDALGDAMRSVTSLAWESLEEVQQKLDAVPIPIRPVQNLLNRLDSIRMLEAFTNLPDRSRERLQDELERVRVRLDQARTTRDNIARGAEEAMEKGHITTALYDMARAVDSFEDEHSEESGQLSERLERARRLKKELERVIVENHRLAADYAKLLDDETSSVRSRIAVLEKRKELLAKLAKTLGPEKGAHYATDLRDVTMRIAREKADEGERQFDRATDARTRLKIARATLSSLSATSSSAGSSSEIGGSIHRLLDHWQHKEREVDEQLRRERRAAADRERQRRRATITRIGIAAAVLITVFGTWGVVHAMRDLPPVIEFEALNARVEPSGSTFVYPKLKACLAIARFADRLDAADLERFDSLRDLRLAEAARSVADHLNELAGHPDVPHFTWRESFKRRLSDFDSALGVLDERIGDDEEWSEFFTTVRSFGREAHLVGLNLILISHTDPKGLDEAIAEFEGLQHLAVEPSALAHLRQLVRGG